MARMQPIQPDQAEGKLKDLVGQVKKKMGRVPNVLKVMANSQVALGAYLGLSEAVAESVIPLKIREQVALALAQQNECHYCIAAHSAIGKMAGLKDEEILDARSGKTMDPKAQVVVDLAKAIVKTSGCVKDEQLEAMRKAGYGDREIAEVVSMVVLNLYTNLFNHVADTEIDFPAVPAFKT